MHSNYFSHTSVWTIGCAYFPKLPFFAASFLGSVQQGLIRRLTIE